MYAYTCIYTLCHALYAYSKTSDSGKVRNYSHLNFSSFFLLKVISRFTSMINFKEVGEEKSQDDKIWIAIKEWFNKNVTYTTISRVYNEKDTTNWLYFWCVYDSDLLGHFRRKREGRKRQKCQNVRCYQDVILHCRNCLINVGMHLLILSVNKLLHNVDACMMSWY